VLVVDCSVTMAWAFEGESTEQSLRRAASEVGVDLLGL
jgi:hypothetical protein